MTFKAESDDVREALSFKIRKLLEFAGARVLCADPYLEWALPLDEVLRRAEALILCTPHREYRDLKLEVPLVDVWGILEDPELEIWTAQDGKLRRSGTPR
jgi:UDP-N-acetyl-D-mannosaminuronic acid dehydrogenase